VETGRGRSGVVQVGPAHPSHSVSTLAKAVFSPFLRHDGVGAVPVLLGTVELDDEVAEQQEVDPTDQAAVFVVDFDLQFGRRQLVVVHQDTQPRLTHRLARSIGEPDGGPGSGRTTPVPMAVRRRDQLLRGGQPIPQRRVGKHDSDLVRRSAGRLDDRSLDRDDTQAIDFSDLGCGQRRPVHNKCVAGSHPSGRSADVNPGEVQAPGRQTVQHRCGLMADNDGAQAICNRADGQQVQASGPIPGWFVRPGAMLDESIAGESGPLTAAQAPPKLAVAVTGSQHVGAGEPPLPPSHRHCQFRVHTDNMPSSPPRRTSDFARCGQLLHPPPTGNGDLGHQVRCPRSPHGVRGTAMAQLPYAGSGVAGVVVRVDLGVDLGLALDPPLAETLDLFADVVDEAE